KEKGGGRRLYVIGAESAGFLPPIGIFRGQDPQGRQACRPPHRAAYEVRIGHQPQDRQGPWPHDPTVAAAAGGSGHRITIRIPNAGALLATGARTSPSGEQTTNDDGQSRRKRHAISVCAQKSSSR